ncbi:hypothetical protein [Amycolatopsis sp. H20-H5]|uniref:hypothetical protein n=1 Tax=Amycolatopsis sp. H20-H5 TaxID=3046309 RepID=UPI002DBFED72|nr:hypothetical protein [Amycolatopsis sp. H20-H5]MEC3978811.1 hypothetical protein [Amycolatopsis sp. H20-H5]
MRKLLAAFAGCLVLTGCTSQVGGAAVPAQKPPASLDCVPAGRVAPEGAPYCYRTPDGFTQLATESTSAVTTSFNLPRARTVTGFTERDSIAVSVYKLEVDSDKLPSDQLRSALLGTANEAMAGVYRIGADVRQTVVSGSRAYLMPITGSGYTADAVVILRGHTQLEILCRYDQHQAEVQRGCAQLRDSIRVLDFGRP